jgi:membrane protease YdiL (CAAX protease family)
MRRKTGSEANPLEGLATFFMLVIASMVHWGLCYTLISGLDQAQLLEMEKTGRLVVPKHASYYLDATNQRSGARDNWEDILAELSSGYRSREFGGTNEFQKAKVLQHASERGREGFISEKDAVKFTLEQPSSLPDSMWPFVSAMLLWWFLMLVFQGEGLEMDFQRRRHPMWEWLASHPIRPVAAFSADMLSAFVTNPIYWSAPLFWCFVWSEVYGFSLSVLAASVLVGLPLAVAASCLHKGLEIAILLRLPSRTRGAALGLMSWAGYCLMMLPLFMLTMPMIKRALLQVTMPLAHWLPVWPMRSVLSGWTQSPLLWQAITSVLGVGALILVSAVLLSWWGTQIGMQASNSAATAAPRSLQTGGNPFLTRHPLYRKELLWFWRDKGAVIQAILIPLTIGAMQAFNLRGLAEMAASYWNGICGFGVICGTYFLLVLGPRSLASEGPALWMTLTWPQGLEMLLKAKARLWWMLASGIVFVAFFTALVMFPHEWWKVALVALGWLVFSRSLAEKAVTLVMAPSSSGESERPPAGRQWAAMLGTLAFGTGVMTQNWHSAVLGVVFSSLTAAAMWQNLRARLPYLYDPWSEKLPPAPTLMHSMIAVTILIEVMALVTGIAYGSGGADALWMARAISYGLVGTLAWLGMVSFLNGRGVLEADIWYWRNEQRESWSPLLSASGGAAAGILLGGSAALYMLLAQFFPAVQQEVQLMHDQINSGGNRWWYALLAVGFAPIAEEFFFRGLLYRALDREWGGRMAIIGSAAFFTIYHPPLSWPPVFAVGLANAWIFKKTGHLSACVALHMAYNAAVVCLT